MSDKYDRIRELTLQYFKGYVDAKESYLDVDNPSGVNAYFSKHEIDLDDEGMLLFKQVVHELYIAGILIPGAKQNINCGLTGNWSFPYFRVTEFGKSVLNSNEYQPHDPTGYLKQLRNNIPQIDVIIIQRGFNSQVQLVMF